MLAFYVIRAEDLVSLENIAPEHPSPVRLEWINRGTDQKLKPTTVQMLIRTLYKDRPLSPSVIKAHKAAGLRVYFRTGAERDQFAKLMQRAAASDPQRSQQ